MLSRDLLIDLEDAWLDIKSKPYRSVLSSLGIGVGVMALVAMLSITSGAKRVALESATSLGLDTVRIETINTDKPLRAQTARLLARLIGSRAKLAHFRAFEDSLIRNSDVEARSTIIDASDNFFVTEHLNEQSGVLWKRGEMATPACALGFKLALQLQATLGDTLVANDVPCKLTAILNPRPSLITAGTALTPLDFNNSLFRSWTLRYGADAYAPITGVVARLSDGAQYSAVSQLLRTHLQTGPGKDGRVQVVVPRELANQVDATQKLFSWVMTTIAALALLVGGIGIANSLLATVAEQTREIGLRLALGAHENRVVTLYLLHALLLCVIGASAGALFGLVAAFLVATMADWPVTLSFEAVAVGLVFALVTGAIAAVYPALRASVMTPAEALLEH